MATLDLNALQLQNSIVGIALPNLVYDLSNTAAKGVASLIQVNQAHLRLR